ncbi:nucleotide exchange factor GrpE [Cognatiyoonia sp. IB215446]|uniref:nucleotide exchange factor GrpE n=1 Tax=Cognatiyoonia sp. IB215446 TaxID=3097355 RepID=UPI002A156B06|nr:nucleotide exchange factor GrpE [Cognatiyoonia sp. IB215446]MDX8349409.1 nucleotide exchange factor GrpE [Cognatiyoonia sp. IB215446]
MGSFWKRIVGPQASGLPGPEWSAATPEEWWRLRLSTDIDTAILRFPDEGAGDADALRVLHASKARATLAMLFDTGSDETVDNDAFDQRPDPTLSAIAALDEKLTKALEDRDRSGDYIDKLRDDNKALRTRADERRDGKILLSFIALYDDLRSMREQSEVNDAPSDALLALERQTLSILRRHGAQPFEPEPGAPFDGQDVQAIDRIVTQEPAADLTVAKVHKAGFAHMGRTLRQASVTVYGYEKPVEPKPQ